jgi:hypothetical protein
MFPIMRFTPEDQEDLRIVAEFVALLEDDLMAIEAE